MIKSKCVTLQLHSSSSSLLASPSGPKWVTEERLTVRAQPKYLKVFPLKGKSLGALGDSGEKKKKDLFQLFVMVSIFHVFVSGASGSVADGAGQSCTDNKRGVFTFHPSWPRSPGVKMTIDRPC